MRGNFDTNTALASSLFYIVTSTNNISAALCVSRASCVCIAMADDEAAKAEINALYDELDGRKRWKKKLPKELRELCDRAKRTALAGDIFEGMADQAQSSTMVKRLKQVSRSANGATGDAPAG